MRFADEFKAFALKARVMDLTVGEIIGAVFGKAVDAMVTDLLMLLVKLITGWQVDFSNT